jgi:hypothetical protein
MQEGEGAGSVGMDDEGHSGHPDVKDAQPPGKALHALAIDDLHAGWKLSKFVSAILPQWSRNAAAAGVKAGSIVVNGELSGANRVLEVGDQVEVHAEPPPAAEVATGPTLGAAEIDALVAARSRAKAARDFATADRLHAELTRSRVRLDDRAKTWTAPGGLSGVQVELSAEEVAALRKKPPPRAADSPAPASAAEAEKERRRIKNMKKRQSKARRAAGGDGNTASAAASEDAAGEGVPERGGDENQDGAGTKRKLEEACSET